MRKKVKQENKVSKPAKAASFPKKEQVKQVEKTAKSKTKTAAKPTAKAATKAKPAKTVASTKAEKAVKVANIKAEKNVKTRKAAKVAQTKKVKKVSTKKVPTRQLILETAGELFAEYGMKGTSIKMIADHSKQNIAAANYHFGSKQNLYIDTVKYVIEKLSHNIDLSKAKINRKNFEAELEKFVKSRTKLLLSRANPSWYGSLIVRLLQEASQNIQEMALGFFRPEVEFLENMAKAVNSKISPITAKMWAYSVISQIIFYVFARRMILLDIGKKRYSAEFINELSQHIVHSAKVALKK